MGQQAAERPDAGRPARAGEWEDLVTAALIGTERKAVPPPHAPGFPVDPAAMLLDRAAIMTAARRAGRMPGRAEPLPEAPDDPRPAVTAAAARRLARILGGEHPDLLAEWLRVAAACERRPPDRLLPALLDRAARARGGPGVSAGLRPLAAAAGGPRARWLAALNPAWAFLLEPAAEDLPGMKEALRVSVGKLVARVGEELAAIRTAMEVDETPELRARAAALRFRYDMLRELDDDS